MRGPGRVQCLGCGTRRQHRRDRLPRRAPGHARAAPRPSSSGAAVGVLRRGEFHIGRVLCRNAARCALAQQLLVGAAADFVQFHGAALPENPRRLEHWPLGVAGGRGSDRGPLARGSASGAAPGPRPHGRARRRRRRGVGPPSTKPVVVAARQVASADCRPGEADDAQGRLAQPQRKRRSRRRWRRSPHAGSRRRAAGPWHDHQQRVVVPRPWLTWARLPWRSRASRMPASLSWPP